MCLVFIEKRFRAASRIGLGMILDQYQWRIVFPDSAAEPHVGEVRKARYLHTSVRNIIDFAWAQCHLFSLQVALSGKIYE